jgi:hypothetical protein
MESSRNKSIDNHRWVILRGGRWGFSGQRTVRVDYWDRTGGSREIAQSTTRMRRILCVFFIFSSVRSRGPFSWFSLFAAQVCGFLGGLILSFRATRGFPSLLAFGFPSGRAFLRAHFAEATPRSALTVALPCGYRPPGAPTEGANLGCNFPSEEEPRTLTFSSNPSGPKPGRPARMCSGGTPSRFGG